MELQKCQEKALARSLVFGEKLSDTLRNMALNH